MSKVTSLSRLALAASLWLGLSSSSHAIIQSQSRNTATQGAGITTDWTGVANILRGGTDPIANQWGSGTLIRSAPGTAWILTAAHVLFDGGGNRIPGTQFAINFPEPGITNTFYFIDYAIVHPGYNPVAGVLGGNDIAMIRLSVDVNAVTTAWDYNRGQIADERGNTGGGLTAHKVGFGLGGDGVNGASGNAVNNPNPGDGEARQGFKREGTNHVDMFGGVGAGAGINDTSPGAGGANLLVAPANTLIYDFDDHLAAGNGPLDPAVNAALGLAPLNAQFTGPVPVNGPTEADTAPGDSGGPMFMFDSAASEFIVVGITSYGTDGPDAFDNGSRFGDIAVDTRVSAFAPFVNSLAFAPEPGSLLLAGVGGLLFLKLARRRSRA